VEITVPISLVITVSLIVVYIVKGLRGAFRFL
jgi:hypothetical protein